MSHERSQQLSEIHGRTLAIPPGIAHEMLTESAKKWASKTAIVSMHQPADLYSSISKADTTAAYLKWSFKQLVDVSHAMAIALAEAGARPGMKVAAYVENILESTVFIRACLELNCPVGLLNPHLAGNEREARHFFELLQPSIILVPNSDIANKIEKAAPEDTNRAFVKLVCEGEKIPEQWQGFETFLEGGSGSDKAVTDLKISRSLDDVVLILFTSGTTSLPKGAPHTNRSWTSIWSGFGEAIGITEESISCNHVAPFHIFGLNFWTLFHFRGCKVVYPSRAFDAKATLQAVAKEKVNIIPGVPAMISALLQHPDFKTTDTSIIDLVLIGATTVLPKHIQMCMELGADRATDSYGMTEAGCQWSHTPGKKPEDTYPSPGTSLRVCDPQTGKPLPRGEHGELHLGGFPVVNKYLLSSKQDKSANDVFYDDEAAHWLRSGDRAVMAENGEVSVIGRYKDVIVRGGENVSPAAIEQVLAEEFGLVAEVVALPDDIAGEVPVAILQKPVENDISDIRGKITEQLGGSYAPEEIIAIQDLEMDDFPKTSSGKVQKHILRERVAKHLGQSDNDEEANGSDGNGIDLETLTTLWARHLGVSTGKLQPQSNVLDFGDSLVLSRFSQVLRKNTGAVLSLPAIMENPTIKSQLKALSLRNTSQADTDYTKIYPARTHAPTRHDMVHAMESDGILQRTKNLSEEVLSPLGLSWDGDVQDVIPLYPTLKRFITKRRPQSTNHRHTWLCKGKSVEDVEEALKKVLAHHNIMRTLSIQYDAETTLHVTIRPSSNFFSQSFTRMPSVGNAQDLWKQCYNDPKLDWAAAPGPLFRATISHVEDQDCAGMVYMAQHSNFDGVSLEMFLQDLDIALAEPDILLTPRAPYKAWADNYYNLRHSEAAQRSIDWEANRLKGIGVLKTSLFPEKRAEEWFKGNSDGWINSDGKPGAPRKAIDDGLTDGVIGTVQRVRLLNTKALKSTHGIEIPQLVKGALAIVNARRTKTNTALFAQYQAGRAWPFLLDWQAKLMPDAMDIDGPTVQSTALKIAVHGKDTLINLLKKLQEEQGQLNEHSFAPADQLRKLLNDGKEQEGDIMEEIIRRQIFNWLPGGLSTEYKSLELVQMLSRTDVGLLWNCKMVDEDMLQIHASWDDAQLSGKEVEELLKELVVLTEVMAREENWGKCIDELA